MGEVREGNHTKNSSSAICERSTVIWAMYRREWVKKPLGDEFQLMCHNNVDFFVPVFATWFLGGRTSVVSPMTTPTNVAKQLSTIDIRHVFCAPASLDSVVNAVDILNHGKAESQIKVGFTRV